MASISTHVLDTALGKPAAGIRITLEKHLEGDHHEKLAEGLTNSDGRLPADLLKGMELPSGQYRITFWTREYFDKDGRKSFYPFIGYPFLIENPGEHYHVPLLISGFGFSTYRGS